MSVRLQLKITENVLGLEAEPNSKALWHTVFALKGSLYRYKEGRKTFRCQINQQKCFVKLYTGSGWKAVMTRLWHRKSPALTSSQEYRAAKKLTDIGVPTLEVVGYGIKRFQLPASKQSFLITKAIEPATEFGDWLLELDANGRKEAIVMAAALTRTMHRGGVNHRDYNCQHLLYHREKKSLILIDLHRTVWHKTLNPRWAAKDLLSLYFSLRVYSGAVSLADVRQFMRQYCRDYLDQKQRRVLWIAIRKRLQQTQKRRNRQLNSIEHQRAQ